MDKLRLGGGAAIAAGARGPIPRRRGDHLAQRGGAPPPTVAEIEDPRQGIVGMLRRQTPSAEALRPRVPEPDGTAPSLPERHLLAAGGAGEERVSEGAKALGELGGRSIDRIIDIADLERQGLCPLQRPTIDILPVPDESRLLMRC